MQYITKDGVGTYLPPHFWYDGMFKIKGGKGYLDQKTGKSRVVGRIGNPCIECETPIIHLTVCISSRGSEFTTEKVCPKCGLVHDNSMFDMNQEFINQYRGSSKGMYTQAPQRNFGATHKRIKKAYWRLGKTPASIKQPMQDWRSKQYHEIAEDYIHELELNKLDARDVHYYIDNIGLNNMHRRSNKEDIILHLCAYVGKIDLRKLGNRYKKYLIDSIETKILC